jgi:hypothetical protein
LKVTLMPTARRLSALAGAAALVIGIVPVVIATQATGSTAYSIDRVTVHTTADAWVTSAEPEANYGATNWVTTDASPTRYGYYRFAVSVPDGAMVTHAEFRCLPGSSNSSGAEIWSAPSTWDEQTITWNTAPRPDTSGSPLGATGAVDQGQWASADITGQVKDSGTYTFVTSTESRVAWSCASRENDGNAPAELVLTLATAAPEPSSTSTPTSSSSSSSSAPTPPPSSSTSTPPPSSSTPAPPPSSTSPPPTTTGHKVLVIPLENHSQSDALAQMPHLTGWAQAFGQATNYYAITHPSLPNYFAIFGGSTFGVTSDCSVGASNCVPDAPSVWGQTLAAGGTARAYQESMTSNCQTSGSGDYAPRHGPWPYWTDSGERAACQANDVPSGGLTSGPLFDDIVSGHLPTTGELTPNLCNDAHDCSLATADTWLAEWLPVIMAGPDFTSGRLTVIVTFDEDDSSQNNKVAFVVIDLRLHAVTVTGTYNHYSLTRWLDDNAGVPHLRNAASAPDLRAAFGLS